MSVGTLTLGSLPAGHTYVLDTTSVAGQVNLIVTQPSFGNIQTTASGLVISGTGGTPNTSYYVLGTTNLLLPPGGWTRLLTNQFDANGNFIFTNVFNAGAAPKFYRLQLP